MKIAIIGAGFTGLSAAYELIKQKHQVTLFEKDSVPGGLAIGYKEKNWDWSLEKDYHHWFTNDKTILNLAKELGHEVIIKRPKTSIFVKNKIYQLDSVLSVLLFPLLSLSERLRMGVTIAFLRFEPFWKPLEKYQASKFLAKFMGRKAYQMIWEPLFINKFGKYSDNISLAWFWARLQKRTPSLAYPRGGFLEFAKALAKRVEKNGGKIFYESETLAIKETGGLLIKTRNKKREEKEESFDRIIVTVPSFLFIKIAPQLPNGYIKDLKRLKGLGATDLVLRLKKPFFKDNTYWLNVCDKNTPVMAIVEHTNYMDKKYYGGENLVYLGNYKSSDDQYFKLTKQEILRKFDPYLKKINPDYSNNIISYKFFKTFFAQPVIPVNYSKILPPLKTPLKNVFLANIEQVYPWDRGTNYAVELGQRIAKLAIS